MLKIRLARGWRKGLPFYRIVLTEHTKPAQSGYKLVLWRFNPLSHTMDVNLEEVKIWISKWAQLSERVAKLLYAETKDELFKKYFVERTSTKALEIHNKRIEEQKAAAAEKAEAERAAKEAEEEAKKAEQEAQNAAEAPVEEAPAEETPAEAPVEEAPVEETPAE